MLPVQAIDNAVRPGRPCLRPSLDKRKKAVLGHLLRIQVRSRDELGRVPAIDAAQAGRVAVGRPLLALVVVVDVPPAAVTDVDGPGAFEALGRVDIVVDVGGAEVASGIGDDRVVRDPLRFEGADGGFDGPLMLGGEVSSVPTDRP